MNTYTTYISYVIQNENMHIHKSEVVDFSLPRYSFYLDNSSQQIIKWAEEKQQSLNANEKIVIINFFNIQM